MFYFGCLLSDSIAPSFLCWLVNFFRWDGKQRYIYIYNGNVFDKGVFVPLSVCVFFFVDTVESYVASSIIIKHIAQTNISDSGFQKVIGVHSNPDLQSHMKQPHKYHTQQHMQSFRLYHSPYHTIGSHVVYILIDYFQTNPLVLSCYRLRFSLFSSVCS